MAFYSILFLSGVVLNASAFETPSLNTNNKFLPDATKGGNGCEAQYSETSSQKTPQICGAQDFASIKSFVASECMALCKNAERFSAACYDECRYSRLGLPAPSHSWIGSVVLAFLGCFGIGVILYSRVKDDAQLMSLY